MKSITLDCKAKINLAIDVVGKRENGYHDVKMVMQEVDLCDVVTINTSDFGIKLSCSGDENIPCDRENIAYKAAEKFFMATKINSGATIHIEKHIPSGAGMAGGSADAAGVLMGLNRIFENPLSIDKCMELGTTLGADVPFCIHGGCVLAEGIGEVLTPLGDAPNVNYLIAKPKVSVSTKWVYENLDYTKKPKNLCVKAVAEGIMRGDLEMIIKNAGNILENVTINAHPIVGEFKEIMYKNGAMLSLMSGSGSSVFGMFENKDLAKRAMKSFSSYTDELYIV
ncbi:MAG: 4-(cytidine 5'-diphospho)-2-C-methyl-D-erythritol kinase [Oscillospiraceae bacterium]